MSPPRLSLVLVAYDMAREIPRTLQSLAPGYQRGVAPEDYEVIVVDNGSPEPLDPSLVARLGPRFRCHRIDDASPSPVPAIQRGVALARGEVVGLLLDGARLLTPGVLAYARLAFRMHEDPTVATLSWHLGLRPQQDSVREGYSQAREDALLDSIAWPRAGYRLFEIGSLGGSSADGFFLPLAESNAIFVRRDSFDRLGGYDPAFDAPGGGLANVDFYKRACERPGAPLVVLLGEGSFHQFHGGVSTNVPRATSDALYAEWSAQYRRIRGCAWSRPGTQAHYLGGVPPEALAAVAASARTALERARGDE